MTTGAHDIHPLGLGMTPVHQASPLAIPVPDGSYSLGGPAHLTHDAVRECPPGSYCAGGIKRPCPAGR